MYVNNVSCVIVCSGDTDAETVKCRVARETGRDSDRAGGEQWIGRERAV